MAGHGNSVKSFHFEDLLHCMICFDSFNNPKMLRCGHTFCQECIQGYYNTYQQQKRAHKGKLPCPTCRDLTTLPPGGVAALKNDFKVQKMEEMFKTINIRDRAGSKRCDPCRANKKHAAAKAFCSTCNMNYCEDCFIRHDRNPLFKDHKIIDKSTGGGASDFICKVHSKEQGKYFCRTCETILCTICVMNDHEEHDVQEITDAFHQQQNDIRNLHNVVQTKMEDLRKQTGDLESLRQMNLNSCQQAEITIKDRTKQLLEMLHLQEAELLEELKAKRDDKLKMIEEEKRRISQRLNKAGTMQAYVSDTIKKKSIQVMAIHDELIKRMRTVTDAETSLSNSEVMSVVTFLPGRQEPLIGRIEEFSGSVATMIRSPLAAHPLPPRRQASTTGTDISNHIGQSGRPTMLVNVHKYGDGPSEIKDPLGVACLLNGHIVVAEWGNKRLHLFDNVGKSLCVIASKLVGPQGVGVTLKGNVLVSDANHKRLQVFSPRGDSIAKWGLGKFYNPCGVAVAGNGNIVVTDISEHSLSIFQSESRCVKRVGSRGKKSDQFDNPLYVTTGPYNEVIVSDSNNHCLKVFDSSGKFLRKIGTEGSGDGQLKFPRGVCTDYDGNIIVADRNNDRVCQFSMNGTFIQNLLTSRDGIKDPYAVAISITKNLVITEGGADRASLKVFQLWL